MALHATARDELRTKLANMIGEDGIARFRMGAAAKVGMMQPPPQHERLRIRR
jgi:hypothetical protein